MLIIALIPNTAASQIPSGLSWRGRAALTMLTPAFELSQEADFLLLSISVPYTRTSEFDLYIDGEDFKFYAKPYFLR